jgi:quercetin dioxygenase-like cupin family protein
MGHRVLAAALLICSFVASCASPPPSRTVVREVAEADKTASGEPIRLPAGDAHVVFSEYVIPAGAKLPVHKHPYPRIALVLQGTIAVTDAVTKRTVQYGPGAMIVESVGTHHFGETVGSAEVRLHVLDLLAYGVKSNVILKE